MPNLPARRPRRGEPRRRESTQALKVLGEEAAAGHLMAKGWKVVARNWRTRFGEIDLIAMEGSTLVFVEVKARRVDDFVDPALGVDWEKQKRLRRLAAAYLAFETPPHGGCRFDVISVISGRDPIRVRHIPNAF